MQTKAFRAEPPRVPKDLSNAPTSVFTSGATLQNMRFQGLDLSSALARNVDLKWCALENLTATNAKLEKFGTCDVVIKHPDFTTSNCSEASMLRTVISDGRMTGWDADQGVFTDVTFERCKLDMANFRATKLTHVIFVECILTETDFLGAELTGVAFRDCVLERTEFSQCKMQDVDLRSSSLVDLRGWQYMKGVILDNVQLLSVAPYIASALGIHVADEQ